MKYLLIIISTFFSFSIQGRTIDTLINDPQNEECQESIGSAFEIVIIWHEMA